MKFKKKDVKKIKSATKEELSKLHEEYKAVKGNVSGMSPAGLFAISILGIIVIFYFKNTLAIVVGLVMLLYPLYIFIKRGAHREGYFEGYYEMMTKLGSRDQGDNSKNTDEK